jgi:hypothetical protein
VYLPISLVFVDLLYAKYGPAQQPGAQFHLLHIGYKYGASPITGMPSSRLGISFTSEAPKYILSKIKFGDNESG